MNNKVNNRIKLILILIPFFLILLASCSDNNTKIIARYWVNASNPDVMIKFTDEGSIINVRNINDRYIKYEIKDNKINFLDEVYSNPAIIEVLDGDSLVFFRSKKRIAFYAARDYDFLFGDWYAKDKGNIREFNFKLNKTGTFKRDAINGFEEHKFSYSIDDDKLIINSGGKKRDYDYSFSNFYRKLKLSDKKGSYNFNRSW